MNCIQPSAPGRGDVEVGAEGGLDLVDPGQHRGALGAEAVLGGGPLVDRDQHRGDAGAGAAGARDRGDLEGLAGWRHGRAPFVRFGFVGFFRFGFGGGRADRGPAAALRLGSRVGGLGRCGEGRSFLDARPGRRGRVGRRRRRDGRRGNGRSARRARRRHRRVRGVGQFRGERRARGEQRGERPQRKDPPQPLHQPSTSVTSQRTLSDSSEPPPALPAGVFCMSSRSSLVTPTRSRETLRV